MQLKKLIQGHKGKFGIANEVCLIYDSFRGALKRIGLFKGITEKPFAMYFNGIALAHMHSI